MASKSGPSSAAGSPDKAPKGDAADAWNEAACEMLDEALRTQEIITEALHKRNKEETDLDNLKQECDEEIEDLQEEAWRLAMYTELERMRLQLAMLTPLGDEEEAAMAAAAAAADKGEGASSRASAAAAGTDGSADPGDKEGGSGSDEQRISLAALDDEIAAVDAQLKAAKSELMDMMSRKAALQEDMADILAAQDADDEPVSKGVQEAAAAKELIKAAKVLGARPVVGSTR